MMGKLFILATLAGGGYLGYKYWWVPRQAAKGVVLTDPEEENVVPPAETAPLRPSDRMMTPTSFNGIGGFNRWAR